MPDSFTANYNFTKPEIAGSRDAWGDKDNENWNILDGILKSLADGKVGGVLASGVRTITENINFTGSLKSNDVVIATQDWVANAIKAAINAALPSTIIAMHRGTVASIPAGWVLCDGANGTIDLRKSFIVGAGGDTSGGNPSGYYTPGATGGALTHDHGGATGGHALTAAENGPHTHGVTDPTHIHNIYDPGHAHSYAVAQSGPGVAGGVGALAFGGNAGTATGGAYTGISINGAATGISIQSNGSGTAHTHPVSAADHRPPYYAICFIQRVPTP